MSKVSASIKVTLEMEGECVDGLGPDEIAEAVQEVLAGAEIISRPDTFLQVTRVRLQEQERRMPVRKFAVTREPDDPLSLRISIGGGKMIASGAYMNYRGDPMEVLALLRTVTDLAEQQLPQLARRRPQG